MNWEYKGRPYLPEHGAAFHSFVYIITNLENGRRYVGKKKFCFTRRVRKKGQKRRTVTIKPSDWEDYYGSSKDLLADVEKLGKDKFKREIVRLCSSPGEATYLEAHLQFRYEVLLNPDDWYNHHIFCRVHRNHIKKLFTFYQE